MSGKKWPGIGRIGAVERHLAVAAKHRDRSIELVEGVEVLMGKLAEIPAIPLDVLDRYERAVVRAHTDNLLRIPTYATLDETA